MLLQKLRMRVGARLNGDREAGFTLVELLVVMLILGLLAAIAIPSFFNQRDKAKDASAKEMAHTAQTAMETYATDNGGIYTGVDPTSSTRSSRHQHHRQHEGPVPVQRRCRRDQGLHAHGHFGRNGQHVHGCPRRRRPG